MKFISTRGLTPPTSVRDAIQSGIAPDGGLYIPESWPQLPPSSFDSMNSFNSIAAKCLGPFFEFEEDPISFQTPLTQVKNPKREFSTDYILELYHGPTSAFKDVGAQFLASCIEKLKPAHQKQTVLVATSGDTGSAVAAAFYKKKDIEVVILFPIGKVSPRQQHQLCAWGSNVRAIAVEGNFDDCQRIVKEALSDSEAPHSWISANSINIARILPQMIYYAYASLTLWRKNSTPVNFIIPSGNLGNSVAALWAKKIGLPIGHVYLALNANRGVVDFLNTGHFTPKPSIRTLANAMDVGNPSNLQRLTALYPKMDELRANVCAQSFSDDEIRTEITHSQSDWGQVLCPHTATAGLYRKKLRSSLNDTQNWVLVATAHPAKFESIVEPLIGRTLDIPPALAEILKRPSQFETISASYESLLTLLKRKPK